MHKLSNAESLRFYVCCAYGFPSAYADFTDLCSPSVLRTLDARHLSGTYHTCPAGLLGVPQSGRGIEDQEVQAPEGVPLNSASVPHLAAWNTPANKDEREMLYPFNVMTSNQCSFIVLWNINSVLVKLCVCVIMIVV